MLPSFADDVSSLSGGQTTLNTTNVQLSILIFEKADKIAKTFLHS
jgi:hypothetical protein